MNTNTLTKVAIHGVPRSGTSWVGETINSSPHTLYRFQPLFSYALKDFLTTTSTRERIDSFFRELENIGDDFVNQSQERSSGDYPQFAKSEPTHLAYKEVRYINILSNMMKQTDDVYLCAVIRNPLSVISSWLEAPREFRRDLGWSELEEWRYALKKNLNRPEEFNGYEKWKESTLLFLQLKKQYPNRVHILKYADLVASPLDSAAALFEAIALPMMDSTREFLNQSTNLLRIDPYSVFRRHQRDDMWKKNLSPTIAREILYDVDGTELQQYTDE